MAAPPFPPKGGLSLYANLLEASDPATISSAPVLYSQPENGAKEELQAKKAVDPALRFQPIRRPVVKQKPKPIFPKTIPGAKPPTAPLSSANTTSNPSAPNSATPHPTPTPTPGSAPLQPAQKSTLADWAATEDDEWRYGAAASSKRQRGGRKRKKKRADEERETDWDELYDPTRPTNVEEYLRSDERIREVREWKDLLYRHRREKGESGDSEEDEDEEGERPSMGNQFAPPPNYSFAPPPRSPPPPPAELPDDKSGDDAYARRLAMSQGLPHPPPPPPEEQSHTISRAPVLYTQPKPTPDEDVDVEDEEDSRPALGLGASPDTSDEPRSTRPGQKDFATRLMSKYGWTHGTGLGASESGIVAPLRVQVAKRRKKADADGGGWAEPGGRAKILGGKKAPGAEDEGGKFGPMSEVVVLRQMLEGIEDLPSEVAAGLAQEIGEECGEKYGRVERLYIDTKDRQVFIKFTNQVSALRAVNELEGRIFAGNTIEARFYDVDKFEQGAYR